MSRFFNIIKPVLTLGFLTAAAATHAHEFWIQPTEYRIDAEGPLVANVRVGVEFKGNALAFLPNTMNAFKITDATGTRDVDGRIGDLPAVSLVPQAEGLHVLNLFTTSSTLSYDESQKFVDFVTLHGIEWVLARHAERGLPETGFKEAYTRFVKSLVAVGDGAGQDAFTGMFFELVAGKNPYTDDMSGGMPITVLFKGQPLVDAQVDMFFKNAAGELSRLSVQSNSAGLAVIPNVGDGEYMINAVHMIEPFAEDQDRTGVVWHSLWGSITYAIGA